MTVIQHYRTPQQKQMKMRNRTKKCQTPESEEPTVYTQTTASLDHLSVGVPRLAELHGMICLNW